MGLLQLVGVIFAIAGSIVGPALVPVAGLGVVIASIGVLQAVAAVAGVVILRHQGTLDARTDIDPARVALLKGSILAGAPASRLESAARAMTARPVGAGSVVIRQGDLADRFYLIAEGRFQVTQSDSSGRESVHRSLA